MNPDLVIAEANRVCGMCACKPFRDTFRDFLGPVVRGGAWDLSKPFRQWTENGKIRTEGVSTCSLSTEQIWKGAGGRVPSDWYPYDWAKNPTFVRTHVWAEKMGALGDLRFLPLEGAAIWTASHFIACLTKWFDPWDITLPYQDAWTVEGGGTCLLKKDGHEGRGLQTVHQHHRRYWPGPKPTIADVYKDGSVGPKSTVLGWVDVSRLPG